jgi:hypothetical protein
LAEALLLDQQTLTFSVAGFNFPGNSVIGASITSLEPFVSALLLNEGSTGTPNICTMGPRSLGGYWQVVGTTINVPLPSGFILLMSGLILLFRAKRR